MWGPEIVCIPPQQGNFKWQDFHPGNYAQQRTYRVTHLRVPGGTCRHRLTVGTQIFDLCMGKLVLF